MAIDGYSVSKNFETDMIEMCANNKIEPEVCKNMTAWILNNAEDIRLGLTLEKGPSSDDHMLDYLNEGLEGHGVEELSPKGWDNMLHPMYSYVNMGDTSAPTVMYNHTARLFFVSSLVNVVESWNTGIKD